MAVGRCVLLCLALLCPAARARALCSAVELNTGEWVRAASPTPGLHCPSKKTGHPCRSRVYEWEWRVASGCHFVEWSKETFAAAQRGKPQLLMVGDSLMRQLFTRLRCELAGNATRPHRRALKKNSEYFRFNGRTLRYIYAASVSSCPLYRDGRAHVAQAVMSNMNILVQLASHYPHNVLRACGEPPPFTGSAILKRAQADYTFMYRLLNFTQNTSLFYIPTLPTTTWCWNYSSPLRGVGEATDWGAWLARQGADNTDNNEFGYAHFWAMNHMARDILLQHPDAHVINNTMLLARIDAKSGDRDCLHWCNGLADVLHWRIITHLMLLVAGARYSASAPGGFEL